MLVVEDERDIREMLVLAIELSGCAVTVACDGREALRKLREGPLPCVVVSDLMMPNLDGRDLRRQMLADPRLAGIPFIVVSGVADLLKEVATLRVAAAFVKPVDDIDTLLACIRSAC